MDRLDYLYDFSYELKELIETYKETCLTDKEIIEQMRTVIENMEFVE